MATPGCPVCEPGAEAAAARISPQQLAAPIPVKRTERQPWDGDELAVRQVLLRRLTPAHREAAALDSTLMLQVIRGSHHEQQRLDAIFDCYRIMLDWRAGISADTVLSQPPPATVTRHAEWRKSWHLDIYGEDVTGRPILGHQLGRIDPSTFLDRFDLEAILLQYCRDLEFACWRKRELSKQRGAVVYKQVVILDMDGLGMGHAGSKFRGPVAEVVVLLQNMYPEGTHRIFIINCHFAFRAVWGAVKAFVSEQTQKNIVILSYDKIEQEAAFAELGIGAEQLPVWAGGIFKEEDGLLARHERSGSLAIPTEKELEAVAASAQQAQEQQELAAVDLQLQSAGGADDKRLENLLDSMRKLGQPVDHREVRFT